MTIAVALRCCAGKLNSLEVQLIRMDTLCFLYFVFIFLPRIAIDLGNGDGGCYEWANNA